MIVLCYLRIWHGMPLCDIVGIYDDYNAAMEGIAYDSVFADKYVAKMYGNPTLQEIIVKSNDSKRYYRVDLPDGEKRWFAMIPINY